MNSIIKRNLRTRDENIQKDLNSMIIENLAITDVNIHGDLLNSITAIFKNNDEVFTKKVNSLKRPPNCYFIFWQEKRPEIVVKYPNMVPKNITKKISELWRKMGKKQKEVYIKRAKNLKESFNKQKLEILNFNEDGSKTRRRGRPIGSLNKPEKANSSKSNETKVKRKRGRPKKVKAEKKRSIAIKEDSPTLTDNDEFRSLLDSDELDFDLDS